MTERRRGDSWFDGTSADAPQPSGEKLVSIVRLAISGVGAIILAAYFGTTDASIEVSLALSSAAVALWAATSAAYVYLIASGRYRTRLSFASVAVDVAFVTIVQFALNDVLPLNFVNGPVTTMYFVMIGLAALRKSRRLVLLAGFGSAVVHLFLALVSFQRFVPGWRLSLVIGQTPVEVSFLDEITIAFCLALVGWIVGHVTRELRLSERHYQDLFEHVPDGILIVSPDATVLAVNQRFHEMLGQGMSAPIVGKRIADFLELAPDASGAFAPDDPLGSPTVLRRVDGGRTPVRTIAMPVEYQGEEAFAMSVRDVAEQVHLERQLAQSQKMETIGRLAGGLAHDFNNILGGIIGSASLAERMAGRIEAGPERDKLLQQLQVVQECGENARVVVKRLLTFSRTSVIETQPVDLGALARDVASICRNTFRGDIEIEVEDPPAPLVVRGDSTSLTQALLNLCINASDAMPDGGRLSIRVREVERREIEAMRHPAADPDDDYCCLEVADTGVGMDDGVLEKIFDPFFTTKPPGEGTGLGLSMVYNIARQHGGFVTVASEVGAGSSFEVYLTRARASLLPAEPDAEQLPHGTGRVFVVDDDDMLRATLGGMLSELGYETAFAADGASALERLASEGADIDLVLLDIVMPEMDGIRTLELMRQRGFDVPVVITSGFMNGASSSNLEALQVAGYLRKPFTFMSLAQAVRDALRGAGQVPSKTSPERGRPESGPAPKATPRC